MPILDLAATGKNINDIRKGKGITVRAIQTVFGFNTPQAIYGWLQGRNMPTIDNLIILADILGVTVDQLLVVRR